MGSHVACDGLARAMAAVEMSADRVQAVMVGQHSMLGGSRQAVESIGGRVLAELGWEQVVAGDDFPGVRPLFVVDVRGVSENLLAAALPRIDEAATSVEAQVVVSLDESSIDIVTATLLGRHVQLLCEPVLTDLVLTLALAAHSAGYSAITDTAYEGEAARLKRLNEEVARIAEVLSRLSRRDAGDRRRDVPVIAERQTTFGAEPMHDIVIDPSEIRRAIRGRRLRDQFFGTGLFEEPGWDMILDLFAAQIEGVRVSVSSLCIAAAVAPTTALRWVSKLTEAGLFEREPDPFDRRRAYIELSGGAEQSMRDYMSSLRRAGLSLS